jgi:energy-converting hydrogenase B subunit D
MTIILLLILLIMGILALEAKELLKAVIFLAVFSLISALLFFYLHAPDVALTEAAVGTGVSTVIFIWVIQKTDRKDKQ